MLKLNLKCIFNHFISLLIQLLLFKRKLIIFSFRNCFYSIFIVKNVYEWLCIFSHLCRICTVWTITVASRMIIKRRSNWRSRESVKHLSFVTGPKRSFYSLFNKTVITKVSLVRAYNCFSSTLSCFVVTSIQLGHFVIWIRLLVLYTILTFST